MFKGGWAGRILKIDLTKRKHTVVELPRDLAERFVGGRGFAIKILWDELPRGTDPMSPDNILIFATGPLTGLKIPSSGKMIVASKSPLTGGYGDGNIGVRMAVELKKAGYDAIIIYGRAEKPSYVYIEDKNVQIRDAKDLWGMKTYEADDVLREAQGEDCGVLLIGRAGENLVRYSVIVAEKGRAGGRPGMGAVMGSKNLKAVVIKGTSEIPVHDEEKVEILAEEAYETIERSPNYEFWRKQGTMATIEWAQANSVLPTHNFREGVFELAEEIGGLTMEKVHKIAQRGCPYCNMPCGNIVIAKRGKYSGIESELDYENVAMLGSNLGIGDMNSIIALNRLCDEYGLDTISTGSVLGFLFEAFERGLITREDLDGLSPRWGDEEQALLLIEKIANKEGIGRILALGVKALSEVIGKGSAGFAMHVKGLEISAYDCHAAIGMALAYGTSPIGAHHKDAWFIAWEIKMGRNVVSREKVERLIYMQNIRGGIFETLTVCRLPWIELGFDLDWYPRFFEAATGLKMSLNEMLVIAERIYCLIRAFWIRENNYNWNRYMDYPPLRWFEESLTKGPLKNSKLSYSDYDKMLSWYYELRGWNSNGIPKPETLKGLGLREVAEELKKAYEDKF
ncbi:aldehyde ferredoxin oxidoreductase [Candidatus Geothermarchaeota archaeon]|nr:MAG: aldehyde ferredoxin oxidoreductase [Candidatus Geothermarchaeota archaeon]